MLGIFLWEKWHCMQLGRKGLRFLRMLNLSLLARSISGSLKRQKSLSLSRHEYVFAAQNYSPLHIGFYHPEERLLCLPGKLCSKMLKLLAGRDLFSLAPPPVSKVWCTVPLGLAHSHARCVTRGWLDLWALLQMITVFHCWDCLSK